MSCIRGLVCSLPCLALPAVPRYTPSSPSTPVPMAPPCPCTVPTLSLPGHGRQGHLVLRLGLARVP